MSTRGEHRDPPLEFRSGIDGLVWPAMSGPRRSQLVSLLAQLDHSQWWPEARLLEQQFRQVSLLLAHCWAQLPYYRDRLEAAGYHPERDRCLRSFLGASHWMPLRKSF